MKNLGRFLWIGNIYAGKRDYVVNVPAPETVVIPCHSRFKLLLDMGLQFCGRAPDHLDCFAGGNPPELNGFSCGNSDIAAKPEKNVGLPSFSLAGIALMLGFLVILFALFEQDYSILGIVNSGKGVMLLGVLCISLSGVCQFLIPSGPRQPLVPALTAKPKFRVNKPNYFHPIKVAKTTQESNPLTNYSCAL